MRMIVLAHVGCWRVMYESLVEEGEAWFSWSTMQMLRLELPGFLRASKKEGNRGNRKSRVTAELIPTQWAHRKSEMENPGLHQGKPQTIKLGFCMPLSTRADYRIGSKIKNQMRSCSINVTAVVWAKLTTKHWRWRSWNAAVLTW